MPHQWIRKNEMDRYEGYYLSVLYAHFNAVGVNVRGEDSSIRGQPDLVIRQAGQVFVMQAKVIADDKEPKIEAMLNYAMKQMRECGYAEKYQGYSEPVHLIALVFGSNSRNFLALSVETV